MGDIHNAPPLNYNEYVVYKLGAIESKLDQYLERTIQTEARSTALEKRLGRLENNKYWITGAATGISTALTLFFKLLSTGHIS